MTKDEIVALVKELGAYSGSLGNSQFIFHFYPTGESAEVKPGPAPEPKPARPEYRIDAKTKTSQRVKLRLFPSQAADGPVVRHNEIVTLVGPEEGETRGNVKFLYVEYNGITGWVESTYLVPVD